MSISQSAASIASSDNVPLWWLCEDVLNSWYLVTASLLMVARQPRHSVVDVSALQCLQTLEMLSDVVATSVKQLVETMYLDFNERSSILLEARSSFALDCR
jgi:hypothetical protein